jgi:prolyl-tRNA editing enzyme YbaK/EbsC (Cys-tRNA(Pro) deacylase)
LRLPHGWEQGVSQCDGNPVHLAHSPRIKQRLASALGKTYPLRMSLESVRQFFSTHAPDVEVVVTAESSATVPLAAVAHGVRPEQIAKTICVKAGEAVALVVMAGTARLDNRKFRDRFGVKPRMLGGEDVLELTSHPVGGVCPFGLPSALPIYCDVSLQKFPEVIPAAGASNAAVRINPTRMSELTGAEWIDVCQFPNEGSIAAQ